LPPGRDAADQKKPEKGTGSIVYRTSLPMRKGSIERRSSISAPVEKSGEMAPKKDKGGRILALGERENKIIG